MNILIINPTFDEMNAFEDKIQIQIAGLINSEDRNVIKFTINVDNDYPATIQIYDKKQDICKIQKHDIIQVSKGLTKMYHGKITIIAQEYLINGENNQVKRMLKHKKAKNKIKLQTVNFQSKYKDIELYKVMDWANVANNLSKYKYKEEGFIKDKNDKNIWRKLIKIQTKTIRFLTKCLVFLFIIIQILKYVFL